MFLLQIMLGRGHKNQCGGRPDFPWYTFPNVVAPEVKIQWNKKLAWLKEWRPHVPVEISWTWMDEVGL